MLSLKISRPQTYTAFAVVFRDRHGRETMRGIFSEERPTIHRLVGEVRTDCVARAHSRRSYDRASRLLAQKLGPSWR